MIVQVMVMLFLAIPPRVAHASELVYISEIAWAGSSLSSADEWIELANPSGVDVNIGGWRISGAGSSGRDIIFLSETLIPANGALLVANYAAGHSNAASNVTPDIVTSTISLSNSKMFIELFDADGVLIDVAGDGSAPLAGFSSDTKASMIRTDSELLGDSESVWMTCEMAENMLTSDCGTPGEVLKQVQDDVLQPQDDVIPVPGGVVTSTEPVATSTVATGTAMTSSTVEVLKLIQDDVISSSTEDLVSTSTVMSDPIAASQPSSFQQETIVRFLRLNEVMAAPDGGKEWVELVNLAADRTILLDGLEIHDSVSRAIKLEGELKPQEKYRVFELSSSKLNNGGDSVYLQTSDGIVIDSLTYAAHEKGTLLARDEKQAWQYTTFPTPGGTNLIRMDDEEVAQEEVAEEKEKVIFAVVTTSQALTTSTTTTLTTPKTEDVVPDKVGQQLLRLSEVVPNPLDSKEWIEIISLATSSVSLDGLELHDLTGRLMKLDGGIAAGDVYVAELSSARLNNGGDTVYLQTDEGEVIDELSYEGSQKGFSFALMSNGEWIEASAPTRGEANFKNDGNSPVPLLTSTTSIIKTSIIARASSVSSAKKTTTKKTSTKSSSSKTNTIISINDYTMLHQDSYGGMRIKLRGTVGTLPRHVSGRGFILLNHDGRGLLIRVPSYKKIPDFGSFLTISGTLKFDAHELPYLSLTKKDGWTVEKMTSVVPKIRKVELLAPKAEEAWSLVQVTGVVNDVSGSTVHMIVDDIDVDFKIKTGVAYRASRLSKGDTVSIKGVLDIANDMPVILPRSADEIELVSHAPESFASTTSQEESSIPGWTPFGAAALAVGAIESIKQLKKKFKSRESKPVILKIKEPA